MEWGDSRKIKVIKALEETHQALPEDYLKRPILYPHLIKFIKAFQELDSDRTFCDFHKKVKDGTQLLRIPQPIPFNSIAKYASIYKYTEDMEEFDEFLYFIRAMDKKYLESERRRIT